MSSDAHTWYDRNAFSFDFINGKIWIKIDYESVVAEGWGLDINQVKELKIKNNILNDDMISFLKLRVKKIKIDYQNMIIDIFHILRLNSITLCFWFIWTINFVLFFSIITCIPIIFLSILLLVFLIFCKFTFIHNITY